MFGARYSQLEQEAVDVVGKSKQLKARYCACMLADPDEELGWSRVRELAAAITATMPVAPHPHVRVDADAPPHRSGVARRAPRI